MLQDGALLGGVWLDEISPQEAGDRAPAAQGSVDPSRKRLDYDHLRDGIILE